MIALGVAAATLAAAGFSAQVGLPVPGHSPARVVSLHPAAGFTAVAIDRPSGRAAIVTSLAAHGPAERAGLRIGDIVLDIDGRHGSDIGTRPLTGPGIAHVLHHGVARTVRLR